MKQIIIKYIKTNPNRISFLLWIYNRILGRNKIRISSKNTLKMDSIYMKKTNISVKGINNTIIIKDLSRIINCTIYVRGNNNRIIIDNRVYLSQNELHIEDDNNEISIGEHTSTHGVHLNAIEGTAINIGSDCMISSDTYFRTGDSHSIIDLDGKRLNLSKNISIGNHVWIGTNVLCLKGVHISNNCIVGAGSLLTKKFSEENIILVGNPARVVKYKTNWVRERI